MQKSREGYGKNWMHFVYKLDNLFRNIRVSDENLSVTKAFHFSKLITTLDFLCVYYAIQGHIINFQPFLPSFSIFHAFIDLFWAKWPWNWKAYKLTLERLKLGMVSWSHPHSMCKRVERVMAKTGCTSCTNRTLSFEVSGFRTKTHLLQRHFIFLNLLQL